MRKKPTYEDLERQIQELKQAKLTRKKAETALSDSEAKMRSIFLAAPVGIGVVVDRVFREVNSRFCDITGYDTDELIDHDTRMIYPSDKEYERAGTETISQIGKMGTGSVEARLKRKDGQIIDALLRSAPLDPNDHSAGITFSALDMTERKVAVDALRKNEKMFRSLFDDHAAVKLIIDPDTGSIIAANHAAEAFYGWPRETLTQMKIQQINQKPADTIEKLMTEAKDMRRIHFDFQHRLADGSIRDVEVFSSGVEMNGHRYLHSIVHDITERRKVEREMEALRAQNWQLKKAESLGRMAGAVAHHFNNHLMGITGNLELSMEVMKRGKSPGRNITEALKSARKASEISSLMLTYLGQRNIEKGHVDLSETCRGSLPLLQAALPESITLETDLPPSGPTVMGNADQIRRLIANLVTNAMESYEENGSVRLSVRTVRAEEIPAKHRFPIDWQADGDEYACLVVSDSGCGIEEQNIEKIFDPFYSTKSTGRGLDLPVVLGIVRANDGVITVESRRGQGSTFQYFSPVATGPVQRRTAGKGQPL